MANSIEIDILTKISGNDSFNKIKSGLKDVVKGNDKVQQSIKKTNTMFGKIKSVVKSATSGASSAFSGLKNKVMNSFPVAGVQKLINKMRSLEQNAGSSGKGFDFLKGKLGLIGGAVAGFFAVSKAIDFTKGAIDEYKEALVNATKLQSNMQVVKAYGGDPAVIAKATASLKSQADQLEKIGVYDGDLIVAGQAQLSTFQLTDKHINQLLPKLADVVANQKGMNASSEDFLGTANMFGKAISTGQLAPLKKVGITIDENTIKSFEKLSVDQRVATMQKILGENVGKVNEELAKTPLGKLRNAEIAWGNMKENIGESAVRVMGQFTPALKAITPVVEAVGVGIADGIGTAIDVTKNKIQELAKTKEAAAIGNNLKAGMSGFQEKFKVGDLFGSLKSGANSAISGVMSVFSKLDFASFGANMGSAFDSIKQALSIIIDLAMDFIKHIDWNAVLQQVGLAFKFIALAIKIVVKALAPVVKIVLRIIAYVFNLRNNFINLALALGNSFMSNLGKVKTIFINVFSEIKTHIMTIISFWSSVWETAKAIVSVVFGVIKGIVTGYINGVKAVIQTIISTVSMIISNVKTIFSNGFNALIGIVQSAIDGVKNAIGGIVDKAREVVDKVKGFFAGGFKTEVTVQENVIRDGKKPGEKWTGTDSWKGGVTWVAERGRELINIPGQQPFVANTPTLMDLPAKTQILNNSNTNKALSSKIEEYKEKFNNSKVGSSINNFLGNKTETKNTNSSTTIQNNDKKQSPNINLTFQIIGDPGTNQSSLINKIKNITEETINDIFYKMLVKDGDIE